MELADKLEIIRAMAKFYGYTLNDIIEESDKKKVKMVLLTLIALGFKPCTFSAEIL